MKPFLKILFILSFLLLPMAAFAQQLLTETFVSEDGSYSFQYPRGWFVQEDSETQFTILSNLPVDTSDTPNFNKGTVMVAFIDPSLTSTFASAASEMTPLAIAQMLTGGLGMTEEQPEQISIGDRQAARVPVESSDFPASGVFYVVEVEAGVFIIALAIGEDMETYEPLILDILGSFNVASNNTVPNQNLVVSDDGEDCTVRTSQTRSAVVRSGPGSRYTAISYLPANRDFAVIGQFSDTDESRWWKLDKDEVALDRPLNDVWVSDAQVVETGNCLGVPVLTPSR